MKTRSRKSPATFGGFETRETLRSAAFSGDIRVFAATSDTTVPVCEKDEPQNRLGSIGLPKDLTLRSSLQSLTHGKQASTNVTYAMNPVEHHTAMSRLQQHGSFHRAPIREQGRRSGPLLANLLLSMTPTVNSASTKPLQRSRPIALSITLIVATMIAGLTIRFVPLGLPPIIVKYGGSMLWALMIYWIVSALLPSSRLLAAVTTAILRAGIEFFKLHHAPGLDAFRLTIPGVLLLGRFFSAWDILAYWLAILIGFLIDHHICSAAN